MEDQKFLEYIVNAIVDYPKDVSVSRRTDEMGVLLTLSVNQADMGKVIGREGATAKAIRALVRIIGMKNQAKVNVKINDPRAGTVNASDAQSAFDEAKQA